MNETLLDVLVEAGIRAKDHRYVRSTPNNLGEALRNWAFIERIGGHNCFEVREDLKETQFGERELHFLFPSIIPIKESEIYSCGKWFVHEKSKLEVGWFYHDDTNEYSLAFFIPELTGTDVSGVLKTNDTSKDYMWYFQEKNSGEANVKSH